MNCYEMFMAIIPCASPSAPMNFVLIYRQVYRSIGNEFIDLRLLNHNDSHVLFVGYHC